ncbi:MAG: DUF2892 domain-containing protein [Campylobacterota bacterium]
MNVNVMKIRAVCRPFRIVMGLALIAAGVFTGNPWFFLGIAPLIAGAVNFCPLCIVTKKCDI